VDEYYENGKERKRDGDEDEDKDPSEELQEPMKKCGKSRLGQ
jgi:hypothetical protein